MKKLKLLFLALCIVSGLSGCSEKEEVKEQFIICMCQQ